MFFVSSMWLNGPDQLRIIWRAFFRPISIVEEAQIGTQKSKKCSYVFFDIYGGVVP